MEYLIGAAIAIAVIFVIVVVWFIVNFDKFFIN
jgi:hypothetical protein